MKALLFRASILALGLVSLTSLGCDKKDAKEKAIDRSRPTAEIGPATYVGRKACSPCHDDVLEAYSWSLHDRALSVPEGEIVAAPFSGESAKGQHLEAIFDRASGKPVIRAPEAYPVKFTIGALPFQQYVVEVAPNKLQVFALAYDSRSRAQGGKRWFAPTELDVPPGHPDHYLGRSLNYTTECATCHTTNATLSYDFEKDKAEGAASEGDVSCEACHGPASRHVAVAKEHPESWPADVENFGFDLPIAHYDLRRWVIPPEGKVAELLGQGDRPPERTDEVGACAACHSSRTDLGAMENLGAVEKRNERFPYDDHYLLDLLSDDLYFPDGQAKAQTYSYGSFIQSRHFEKGVVCSDCHNPHSTELRMPAVDLCVTCHQPSIYQATEHHMHPAGVEPLPSCVDCHMPERTFFDVDARRDHAFVLPRPDLTEKTGAPLACDSCHKDKTPLWAKRRIEKFHGDERGPSAGLAFAAAAAAEPEAADLLAAVVKDERLSVFVRASALVRWAETGRTMTELDQAVVASAQSDQPLLRRAAAEASAFLRAEDHAKVVTPLLADPIRSVRLAAVRAHLALAAPPKPLPGFDAALKQARSTAERNAFDAEYLLLIALIDQRLGKHEGAERILRLTIERFPEFELGTEHLVRALLDQEKNDKAEAALSAGLARFPDNAFLNEAHGRALLREGKATEALPYLKQAFESASGRKRREAGYAYAVTLQTLGDWAEALAVLRIVKRSFPEADEVVKAIELFEEKRKK